jgi:hypothetical protein
LHTFENATSQLGASPAPEITFAFPEREPAQS